MRQARQTKPTKANLRRRVQNIHRASEDGRHMARRWNPKGRFFKCQRDVIEFLDFCEEGSRAILELMDRGR